MHRSGFRFVGRMVLDREEQVGTVILQRNRNPVRSARRFCPYETAYPRRTRSHARSPAVGDDRFKGLPCFFCFWEPDPYLSAAAFKPKPALLRAPGSLTENAIDLVRRI